MLKKYCISWGAIAISCGVFSSCYPFGIVGGIKGELDRKSATSWEEEEKKKKKKKVEVGIWSAEADCNKILLRLIVHFLLDTPLAVFFLSV